MKTKFNILTFLASFCLPFSVVVSCQNTQLKPPDSKTDKQLILDKTALILPKTGVYDDDQHLVFDNKPASKKRVYQYHGATINNTNLAVSDADPLLMMKGKNAIELRKNDTVVIDLNFINVYRQANQKKSELIKPIDDFTDLWYKYFTIFDTKAVTGEADSWQQINQALWLEDDLKTNAKLSYNEETQSWFASTKSAQDVFKPVETKFSQENVFEIKLASDKHHLFVTCHYQQTFAHDYFTFAFINLDNNSKRLFKDDVTKSYEKLWESSYIMCNLDKASADFTKISESPTGWTSSILNDLKKDKWLGFLMGTKSIDSLTTPASITRYYNMMWYTPAALYQDSSWYYYAKYTAIGVEGFKVYSKQVEPIKLGS